MKRKLSKTQMEMLKELYKRDMEITGSNVPAWDWINGVTCTSLRKLMLVEEFHPVLNKSLRYARLTELGKQFIKSYIMPGA